MNSHSILAQPAGTPAFVALSGGTVDARPVRKYRYDQAIMLWSTVCRVRLLWAMSNDCNGRRTREIRPSRRNQANSSNGHSESASDDLSCTITA